MKRYTGQKALYEAISRSRAKAKRGNILERLLPEVNRQEKPAPPEEQPPIEPTPEPPEAATPAAKEPPRPLPAPEKPRELAAIRESFRLRRLAKAETPPEKPVVPEAKPEPAREADRPMVPIVLEWFQAWRRWRPARITAGRIEVSVPYHVGIVVALVSILVMLTAFRIGQKYPGAPAQAATPAKASVSGQNAPMEGAAKPPPAASPTASASGVESAPQGDHWLVLAKYKLEADLDEARKYFQNNGVELMTVSLAKARQVFAQEKLNAAVLPPGEGFLLVTRSMYGNPTSPGTEGYKLRQKVTALGKGYKAPAGKESFAPNFFGDAYWMKVSRLGQ